MSLPVPMNIFAHRLGSAETPPHPDHRFATIRPLPARGERCSVRAEMSKQTSRRHPNLSPPAGRGRIASAIRVRGRLRECGGEAFQNTFDIAKDVVIPKSDDTVVVCAQPAVADHISLTVRVLSAVDLNNQAALPAQKVHRVGADRLLPHELEAEQGSRPQSLPQLILSIGCASSQSPGSSCLLLSRLTHVETPPHPALRADLSPHAGRGYHAVAAA